MHSCTRVADCATTSEKAHSYPSAPTITIQRRHRCQKVFHLQVTGLKKVTKQCKSNVEHTGQKRLYTCSQVMNYKVCLRSVISVGRRRHEASCTCKCRSSLDFKPQASLPSGNAQPQPKCSTISRSSFPHTCNIA